MNRNIQSLHPPTTAQDGAGVKLKRYFPVAGLDNVDPFMLLDHFGSDNPDDFIAGFPMHPHRGIETVTYVLEGRIRHKDSTGRSGTIEAGDVQWMSAGRGIMHEEMPEVADGRLDGFQLWVNLPANDKMKKAQYQEYLAKEITTFEHEGHFIRLISGNLFGHQGVVSHISTKPTYADISLNSGKLTIDLPDAHSAFIYVFQGELELIDDAGKEQAITAPELAILSQGDRLVLQTETEARVLLVAGQANNEPIARSGPFVMNTRAEIAQTWREIQNGVFPPGS
jgi:redox-sensitive bicupin YhaK (pirin superfamily)